MDAFHFLPAATDYAHIHYHARPIDAQVKGKYCSDKLQRLNRNKTLFRFRFVCIQDRLSDFCSFNSALALSESANLCMQPSTFILFAFINFVVFPCILCFLSRSVLISLPPSLHSNSFSVFFSIWPFRHFNGRTECCEHFWFCRSDCREMHHIPNMIAITRKLFGFAGTFFTF